MKIFLHRDFKKKLVKLPVRIREVTNERLLIFVNDPYNNEILNLHRLKGKFEGSSSINITGDYRAVFYIEDENLALFYKIGTHDELYNK